MFAFQLLVNGQLVPAPVVDQYVVTLRKLLRAQVWGEVDQAGAPVVCVAQAAGAPAVSFQALLPALYGLAEGGAAGSLNLGEGLRLVEAGVPGGPPVSLNSIEPDACAVSG
jgi:hypothetical protein